MEERRNRQWGESQTKGSLNSEGSSGKGQFSRQTEECAQKNALLHQTLGMASRLGSCDTACSISSEWGMIAQFAVNYQYLHNTNTKFLNYLIEGLWAPNTVFKKP